jgi:hypothetical protein
MRAGSAMAVAGVGLALWATGPATAAPTCLDHNGATIRCGAPGAMPVGWQPDGPTAAAPEETSAPGWAELAGLAAVLGGLFTLLALMPEFDGWDRRDED